MADTVNFTIGGENIAVGPITLYTLQRCWGGPLARLAEPPRVDALDRMERVQAVLDLIATCLECEGKPTSAAELAKRVRLNEWAALDASLTDLFRMSGMGGGDDAPGEAMASSTATGTA